MGKSSGSRLDNPQLRKPQRFHHIAVPRIGGLAIVLSLWFIPLWWVALGLGAQARLTALVLLCALPAFLGGFIEDLTGSVPPRGRLAATMMAAVMAFLLVDAAITRTSIPGLDWLVSYPAGALALTVFSVAGIANSVNIIDGFNGLASMCVMLMLGAIAYVGFQVDDVLIATLAVASIGAVLGFFVWNFPAGMIFLGDGGAYFLGFVVAEFSILLLVRNPEVSPLFPLLVCVYPAFETVFSIYRRWFLRQQPAAMPDGIHLHSLIYRRAMRWAVGGNGSKALARKNSMTSPVLWVLCMASIVPATLFWADTRLLAGFLLLFSCSYVALYWRIVRFRAPRIIRLLGERTRPFSEGDNSSS